MTDSIRTNTFTSDQYISAKDAAALEEKTENQMIAGLNVSDLTDMNIKLAKGEALTAADVTKLNEMMAKVGGDFTAKDLDVLVQQGKLSRSDADLLLAYSSIDGFFDGKATDADMLKAMNNIFVNMNDKDREYTLGLLANQGDYKRTLNVTIGEDGTKSAAYTLSANGEELSPGDLPSTPAIERAMMAITQPSFDATKPGAIKAFADWEFDTSRDELGALLGGLKSYENLSEAQKGELMTYLGAAGSVAAGYPFAATTDPKLIVHQQFMKDVSVDYAEGITKLEALDKRGGLVNLHNEKFVGADGKEMSLHKFLTDRGIAFSNVDGDDTLGAQELKTVIANAKRFQDVHTASVNIGEAKLNGNLPADQLAAMEKNIARAFEGADVLNQIDAKLKDHKNSGKSYDLDMIFVKHGDKVMTAAQFAKQEGLLHGGDGSLNPAQLREFRNNVEHYLRNVMNDQAIYDNQHKADLPGGKKAIDDLQNGIFRQQDLGKMMERVRREVEDNGNKQSKIGDIQMSKTDGSGQISLKDMLAQYGVTYEDKGRVGVVNDKTLWDINGKLEGLYEAQRTANDGFKTALNNIKVPAPEQESQVVSRNSDGGNNAAQISNVNNYVQNGEVDFRVGDGFAEGVLADGLAEELDWDPKQERSFQDAVNSAKDEIAKGESPSPSSILDRFGLSDSETIDIGLLMFVVQSERIKMLGDQIQDIIKTQRQNTREQQDMQEALSVVNSKEGNINLKTEKVALKEPIMVNGEAVHNPTLQQYFDAKGVKYTNDDGDFTLGDKEKETLISNIKGKNEGLSNEGQAIMNELTMLSQKYQQAQSLAMNFLEKFDAMKQKIIDKIRAN